MRLRQVFVACGLALAATATATAGPRYSLEVGDQAPALEIAEWVKGEKTSLETGRVYVVEFWATWCVPCRKSIPHLTELQNDLGPEGLTIIGVSTEEPEKVRPFVQKQGEQMGYTVAVDRREIPVSTLPPGDYVVTVGVYNRTSGQRYVAQRADGQPVPGDEYPLYRFSLP